MKIDVLKLNVGFLLKQNVGSSRDLEISESQIRIADDLELTKLEGKVRLTRTPQGIYLDGRFEATHPADCARCLDEFPLLLSTEISELYVFPPTSDAEFVVDEAGELNMAPLLRELLLLDEPIQLLCRPDCRGLCPVCGENRNHHVCDCVIDTIDPRFAVLQSLLKN